MNRMFANGPEDQVSIPGRIIPKTFKMVPDAALLNTQHYKVRINGEEVQSTVLLILKREPSGHHRLRSPTLLTINLGVELDIISRHIFNFVYSFRGFENQFKF